VQENDRAASVWTVPADSPENAKQIAYGIGGFRGDLSWAPDGRIVFESANAGASDLSIMNPDGSQQTPLLGDMIEKAITVDPAVSRDGRFIFFGSDLEGVRNIWRIDRDGSNPTRLTHGGGEDQPQSSPDGRWLVYRDISAGTSGLCKVAMEGGEPVRISDTIASNPSVSPDGRLVAAFRAHEETASLRLALFSIDGGPPVRIFPQPVRNLAVIRWTRDGKFISYVDTIDGVSNIELQPVEGGQPVRFTNFRSDVIFGFDWSADGKQLACVRGIWKNNLVLISGLR
jgi:Tol biopolymer transport system component